MARKDIIWSNYNVDYDRWKEDFKCWLEDMGYEEDDYDLYEWVDDCLYTYLQDERCNLNVEVDGYIVGYSGLGLWDGRHVGSGTCGSKVRDILYTNCDCAEWYCDRYNVRCNAAHHDGTNHYLYRVAKDRETAERIAKKIAFDGMTEKQFMRATKSLRPYVAKVYGWK